MPTDGAAIAKTALNGQQQSAFNAALRAGIEQKDTNLIKLALANGAEPNILMFAGIAYKPTWLERQGIDDFRALSWIQLAVHSGADVNATNPACTTADGRPYAAIHCAYQNFNEAVSDFLIAKGASVDTPSPTNNTPLLRAIVDGQDELASYYLKKGADPMRVCEEKVFPLQKLQQSDQFRAGTKSKLLTLMMEHIRPPTADPAPVGEFNAAAKDAGLAHEMTVSKPLSLKPRAEKPRRGFTL
jgi:hypothetical protein